MSAPPAPDEHEVTESAERRTGRARHVEVLSICTAVVILALVLQVNDSNRVSIGGRPGWALPSTCLSKSLFHVDCPGCGLTRSFVHLAHGDWRSSVAMHRLGWWLALLVVVQIPYRVWCLARGEPASRWRGISRSVLLITAAGLLVNWVYNLLAG